MKGWVGLVGWPIADGLPTYVVTWCHAATGRAWDRERPAFYQCATLWSLSADNPINCIIWIAELQQTQEPCVSLRLPGHSRITRNSWLYVNEVKVRSHRMCCVAVPHAAATHRSTTHRTFALPRVGSVLRWMTICASMYLLTNHACRATGLADPPQIPRLEEETAYFRSNT